MKKQYDIKKFNEENIQSDIWEKVEGILVECYPWYTNGYMPKTEAKVFYTDNAFHVRMKSYETDIKAVYTNMNGDVYKDSCMEFFFNPNPEFDKRYFNFELNPLGTMFLSIGEGRHDRVLLGKEYYSMFDVKCSESKETLNNKDRSFWSVEYTIPFKFIEEFYGKLNFGPGMVMHGNFYKCADAAEKPHYGCWNPIEHDIPDFHRPEYFGCIKLV